MSRATVAIVLVAIELLVYVWKEIRVCTLPPLSSL